MTWTNVVAKKLKWEVGKLTLASLLKNSRLDKWLIMHLGKDSSYQTIHIMT